MRLFVITEWNFCSIAKTFHLIVSSFFTHFVGTLAVFEAWVSNRSECFDDRSYNVLFMLFGNCNMFCLLFCIIHIFKTDEALKA